MRILIFHGYLLSGTGSNIYTARLVRTLQAAGHEVHLFCQDRQAAEQPFIGSVGDWDAGSLAVRRLRPGVACTAYRPPIGELLPVYVADDYEGFQARTFPECDEGQVDRYLAANVAAVREVAQCAGIELALANHLVMGPVILARALADDVRYAVKLHGSALEYTVKPNMERFAGFALEGLARAQTILAGSLHTAESLWAAFPDRSLRARTRLLPPGVDVDLFRPLPPGPGARKEAHEALLGSLHSDVAGPSSGSFARSDEQAIEALSRLGPATEPLVAFVGKLLHGKGADLLIAAWPLVLERHPRARLALVGFGSYDERLRLLVAQLAAGNLDQAGDDSGGASLAHLRAALKALSGQRRERYLAAAAGLPASVVFTGRLDHDELAPLLGLCAAVVVPSTFPEAFGMIAAEAAACGVLPISAAHSGLAELTADLAGILPAPLRRLLSFELGPEAVGQIAEHLCTWLDCDEEMRRRAGLALRAVVAEHYSWQVVARCVVAAAEGDLASLRMP